MLFFQYIKEKLFKEKLESDAKPESKSPTKRTIFLLAISELVMVVLGILLALYIDRWNEKQQIEEKFTAALKIIQHEISNDIKQTDKIFNQYIHRDSLLANVMGDKLSRQDYIDGISLYDKIIFYYAQLNIHSDGFEILSKFDEEIPEQYEEIFYDLKKFYSRKINVDEYNRNFKNVVWENINYMYNRPWYPVDEFNGIVSEDQIDFYLYNPYYKSLIQNTMNSMRNTYYVSLSFRLDGIDMYKELKEVTRDTSKMLEYINYTLTDSNKLQQFIGNYKLTEGREDSWFETDFEIEIKDNNLVILRENKDPYIFYHFKESIFFTKSGYIFKFAGNGQLKIIDGFREVTIWSKK
tara:strand:+ start:406 stop:1461 length:1056 start_codon:yes stop_codon:yes gene_type:complete